ncbi:hypothetical protein HPULCUR_010983 [Helicostylum pulchrum]|uniref:Uncharacterized protein n=1 Tax=Helicostylum pulchrum TaxID=562976 RepID=A0ABP9YES7_9FUNG
MAHLLLRTPPFYALISVYYILRFSVAFYTTLAARTKKSFYCSQTLVNTFRNSDLGLRINSYQKLDLKQTILTQQYPLSVTSSKQSLIRLRYNKSLCSELLERSKLTTKFKDGAKLIKFNTKDLERLCKQFDQNKDWVSDLSRYPSIKKSQHTFRSLMNTCSLINGSLNHKLKQGYAFKSVCDFISNFIDQTHLQLEELTDAGISRYQVKCLASKVSAGLDFIEELLKSPVVQDIHLHRICVDRIDILIDQCFALGDRINERK